MVYYYAANLQETQDKILLPNLWHYATRTTQLHPPSFNPYTPTNIPVVEENSHCKRTAAKVEIARHSFLSQVSLFEWIMLNRELHGVMRLLHGDTSCHKVPATLARFQSRHVQEYQFHVRSWHAMTSQGSDLIGRKSFFSKKEKNLTALRLIIAARGQTDWEQSTGNNIMLSLLIQE